MGVLIARMRMGARTRRRLRLSRGWPAFLSIAAVFVALRLPSLVEPPTFNDEGTYADIGWALDHGAVLYRDVWGHYTPGVYWLGAAINLLHTSVLAFHIVLAATVALTAFGIWRLCGRFTSRAVAWAATVGLVVLASLPILEGDVLYVEVIGALLVVWAVLLITVPERVTARAAISAGLLVGGALLFKPTFAADAIAVATMPVVVAMASARRPGRREARTLLLVMAGALLLLGVAAGALLLGGSMPGLIEVLTRQDEAYLQAVAGGGAAGGVAPTGGAASILVLMTATRIVFVLAAGAAITWRLSRRHHLGASIVAWWLTWDLAAVLVSGLGLAHYAQQMEPALCIGMAILAQRLLRRLPLHDVALAVATTVSAWAVCVATLVAPTAEATAVVPQPVSAFVSAIVSPQQVTHVVGRGWQRVLGLITPAVYQASFGGEPALVREIVSIIDAHSRPADRVFVWGRVPWAYALSSRLPAGRYTSLNSSYRLDPAARPLLLSQLRTHPPAVLVALEALPPELTAMLGQMHYRRLPLQSNGGVCWIAPRR